MAHSPELPRFIVLKSKINDKYLIHHLSDDKNYLEFTGTDFGSLCAKYEVVRSSTGHELVHLKCCYNNKYWVCQENQHWITAEAHEIEEDQTKSSCTLFKPVFFNSNSNRIVFNHVYIKQNVSFGEYTNSNHLYVGSDFRTGNDYLDFFDWESLPILPRYIALKGDNGNYLSAYTAPPIPKPSDNPTLFAFLSVFNPAIAIADLAIRNSEDRNVYLKFNCKDKGDQTVGNEVFATPDGNIRLKSNYTNRFWKRSPNWIRPDSEDDTNNNSDMLFKVIKVSNNKIALKNLGNDKFCMSLTTDGKADCLNAHSTTIPETAKLEVEELVEKIKIFRVRFHEKAARIYEKQVSHEVKSTDFNGTAVAQLGTLEFEYTKEESQTWTTSNSLKQSIEIEITVGPPDIAQGKLKFGREETTTVENGKTLAIKVVKKYTKTVNVPPMSKVVANFRVTQALCDIPYSYSQTETLHNGAIVTTDREDGLYTCIRTEVFFEANQENIPS